MSASNRTPKSQSVTASATAPKTAKLFKNGRSQAVRLPKEFRFEGDEVLVRRDESTGAVLLFPTSKSPSRSMKKWFDLFDSMEIPEDLFERNVEMPTERDIF